jgi:hypothetical protein
MDLHEQLKKPAGSLFSSDVYQHYSATYAWSSNQTAHLLIGFALATCLYSLFPQVDTLTAAWMTPLIYALKESVDLYLASRNRNRYPEFRIPISEFLSDSATDWLFVSLGGWFALSAIAISTDGNWIWLLVVLVILGLFGWLASGHFIPQKRAFDKSGLPYFLRLALIPKIPPQLATPALKSFLREGGELVITGGKGTGRTRLSVAIGSEFCNSRRRVRYTNAAQLAETLTSAEQQASLPAEPWHPDEAECLIVDDTHPDFTLDAAARERLQGRSVIWVLCAGLDEAPVSLGNGAPKIHLEA